MDKISIDETLLWRTAVARSTRFASAAIAIAFGLLSTVASSAESSGEVQSSEISLTAKIDDVVCRQCLHWKGTGGLERVADKLTVTILTPIQFAGKSIKMFVWDDGGETSQPWQLGSQLSFLAIEEQVDRERVILPYSYLTFDSN
jgi:hypothetical protein